MVDGVGRRGRGSRVRAGAGRVKEGMEGNWKGGGGRG